MASLLSRLRSRCSGLSLALPGAAVWAAGGAPRPSRVWPRGERERERGQVDRNQEELGAARRVSAECMAVAAHRKRTVAEAADGEKGEEEANKERSKGKERKEKKRSKVEQVETCRALSKYVDACAGLVLYIYSYTGPLHNFSFAAAAGCCGVCHESRAELRHEIEKSRRAGKRKLPVRRVRPMLAAAAAQQNNGCNARRCKGQEGAADRLCSRDIPTRITDEADRVRDEERSELPRPCATHSAEHAGRSAAAGQRRAGGCSAASRGERRRGREGRKIANGRRRSPIFQSAAFSPFPSLSLRFPLSPPPLSRRVRLCRPIEAQRGTGRAPFFPPRPNAVVRNTTTEREKGVREKKVLCFPFSISLSLSLLFPRWTLQLLSARTQPPRLSFLASAAASPFSHVG